MVMAMAMVMATPMPKPAVDPGRRRAAAARHPVAARLGLLGVLWRSAFSFALAGTTLYATLNWAAATTRDVRPETALQALSHDAIALAALSSRMQLQPEAGDTPGKAAQLAIAALRRAPPLAAPVRTIGFAKLDKADVAGTLQALRYAHQLSRRDLATELWLAEYAVQQGNSREALAHFDHALSSSNEIHATLFPVMSRAVADTRLAAPMADMLSRQPWWMHNFLLAVAQGKLGPAGAIDRSEAGYRQALGALALFEALGKRGVIVQEQAASTLKLHFPDADRALQARLLALRVG